MKSIFIKITIVNICFCLFSLLSCKKNEDNNSDRYYHEVSPKLESYFFNNSSYWVYQNTKTQQLDSTYVISWLKDSYSVPPMTPGQGSPGDEEYFEITFGSSIRGKFKEELIADIITRGSISGGFLYFGSKNPGDERGNAKLLSIHDSLFVNNELYLNVIEMSVSKDAYIDKDMQLFFKDSVGIIKRIEIIQNDTNSYNLIDYQTSFFVR